MIKFGKIGPDFERRSFVISCRLQYIFTPRISRFFFHSLSTRCQRIEADDGNSRPLPHSQKFSYNSILNSAMKIYVIREVKLPIYIVLMPKLAKKYNFLIYGSEFQRGQKCILVTAVRRLMQDKVIFFTRRAENLHVL